MDYATREAHARASRAAHSPQPRRLDLLVDRPQADSDPDPTDMRIAVAQLHQRCARFVLIGEDKAPQWKGWNTKRPSVDRVLRHVAAGGLVAIQPRAMGCLVVDIDHQDRLWRMDVMPEWIHNGAVPFAVVPSRKFGRWHVWFRAHTGAHAGKFSQDGISGEWISGGYVIQHHTALIPALCARLLRSIPTGLPPVVQPAIAVQGDSSAKTDAVAPKTEGAVDVDIGQRNKTLFAHLRLWAYKAHLQHSDRKAWTEDVRRMADRIRALYPCPQEKPGKVASTVESVATWVWEHMHDAGLTRAPRTSTAPAWRTREVQRARGKRRGKQWTAEAQDRDAEIVRMLDDGLTNGQIAAALDMHPRSIQRRKAIIRTATAKSKACNVSQGHKSKAKARRTAAG